MTVLIYDIPVGRVTWAPPDTAAAKQAAEETVGATEFPAEVSKREAVETMKSYEELTA